MKIALVGGTLSWMRAPWKKPDWQVWAHASMWEGVQNAGKGFDPALWVDVHLPEVRVEPKRWSGTYNEWLMSEQQRTAPVLVEDVDPHPPNSVPLPRQEMYDWLLKNHGYQQGDKEYVTSTATWMLQYALFKYQGELTDIGIWGINFEDTAEYRHQRPCFEHWLGFAKAQGVKVYNTPTSNIGRDPHVYGFDGHHKELLSAHGTIAPGTAVRLRPAHVNRQEPLCPIPPQVQALIDEEIEVFGIDTVARFRREVLKISDEQEKTNESTPPSTPPSDGVPSSVQHAPDGDSKGDGSDVH